MEEARAALEREKRDAERRARELEAARVEAEREAERLRRETDVRARELERVRVEAERETERLRREREEAERDAANLRRAAAEHAEATARKQREDDEKRRQDDERRRRDEDDKRQADAKRREEETKRREEEAKRREEEAKKREEEAEAAAAKNREDDEAAAEARRVREEEIRRKKEDVEKRKQELEESRRKRLEDERDKQAAAAKAQREQLEREKSRHAAKIERKLSEKKIESPPAANATSDTYQVAPGQGDGLKLAMQNSATSAMPSSPPRVSPRQQYATIPLKPKEAPKLPPGWEQHTTEEGEVYYYNESLDESSWVLPTGSGGRWTRHLDENGDVYFYNPVTDESKWELTPEDEALLDEEDDSDAVFEAAPAAVNALPQGLPVKTTKPLPQRSPHQMLPPGPVPAAPKRSDGAKPAGAASPPPTTATATPTGAPLPSSPKLGARPPTEKKKSLFGMLKKSIKGDKKSNGSAISPPTPAVARGSPPSTAAETQAEKNKGKLRKWAKYRRSLEKAQVGLSDYVVRYKGDEGGSETDSSVDVNAELAKTEKELAAARDMQSKFAVMYASNPAERAKLEAEIEELSLKVEQLKAHAGPPDLSADELLQAALRAPVVARCRAKWKYDVVYDGELGFEEGDVIEVIEKVDDTWWHGRLKNRAGMFSKDFVTEI